MAWEFKDIDVADVEYESRSRTRYASLYDKIFSLEVGKGFEIEAESIRDARNIRSTVYATLKRKGFEDKYIIKVRLNKFYCGRVK